MVHFPKVSQLLKNKKQRINYCENEAYYNTTQNLSTTKERKNINVSRDVFRF